MEPSQVFDSHIWDGSFALLDKGLEDALQVFVSLVALERVLPQKDLVSFLVLGPDVVFKYGLCIFKIALLSEQRVVVQALEF